MDIAYRCYVSYTVNLFSNYIQSGDGSILDKIYRFLFIDVNLTNSADIYTFPITEQVQYN